MRSTPGPSAGRPRADDVAMALGCVFGGSVTVLSRETNPYTSTFPGEVVRCRVGGRELAVLCKYVSGRRHPSFGHRGGPGYEAMVYEQLVGRLPLPHVTCHGSWTDRATGGTWLFLEHLAGACRLEKHADPDTAMAAAARWVGAFHRLGSESPGGEPLTVYTADYYAQWARRASELAGNWHRRLPWLRTLCERVEPVLRSMAELPSCTIHGEFTPSNVLVLDGVVIPVDWETAAVGVGAVDLAGLTDGWPRSVVECCEAQYASARWPDGPPADHRRTLELARLYWDLRWLGDRPRWLPPSEMLRRYTSLHGTAQRLALM